MSETIALLDRSGARHPGTAIVRRRSEAARVGAVMASLAGGITLAVPAVVIPPHGAISFAVMLFSGIAAYALWTRRATLDRVDATCAACQAAIEADALGTWSDDVWIRCPQCRAPYRIVP